MTDHSNLKLGKKARKHDSRTLRLARYLTGALPTPPPSVDWSYGVKDWGMMLNDHLGDCIIADGPGHATQVWTVNALGRMLTPPDSLILETYENWCGYNPADPNTDQGGVELDVLKCWQQRGFYNATLDAFAAIDLGPGAPASAEDAIWLFGGAYVGVELPLTAQTQDVWTLDGFKNSPDWQAGSWGGHAIYLVGYDQARPATFTCITWGQLKKMTAEWFHQYCSEAYALISKDWLKASGIVPSGFDLETLEADLKVVTA